MICGHELEHVNDVYTFRLCELRGETALNNHHLRLGFEDLFWSSAGWPMSVALLPASAAPVTAPFAAPVTAPITTSRTTFFALLITPGDERFLFAFLLALFLATREDLDFLVADFLLIFFDANVSLPVVDYAQYVMDYGAFMYQRMVTDQA
jgi:hypothetical protein